MGEVVIEQVRPDIFRTEVPLPRNPLKATNSYIIKDKRRNLVIDTGMHREECKSALMSAFDQLDVDLEQADFFITHMHADHVGLVDELPAKGATVYFNQADADFLYLKDLWKIVYTLAEKHGFPADKVDQAIDSHPGQRYSPKKDVNFTMRGDGDFIRCGDYEFSCLVTPGHTPAIPAFTKQSIKCLFQAIIF